MSRYDYEVSKQIAAQDPPFDALIMAALRKADSTNADILQAAFPAVCKELVDRYEAPGGRLAGDPS